jgi:DNA-binding NarL/FixJ family response regulator
MSINLILADDHPLVLNGLQQLFAGENDIHVVACCTDGESALQSVIQYQPDILLLDLRMPKMDGLTVLRSLRQQRQSVKVVVLTAGIDEDDILSAIQLGVRGLVLKEMAPELLTQCVRTVHGGGEWLEKNLAIRALDSLLKRETDIQQLRHLLTAREINIIKLVANGCSNKQIADKCFISEGTVKVHLHNIYDKLGIKNRVELSLYARDKNLL